jgi:hypothetical protein
MKSTHYYITIFIMIFATCTAIAYQSDYRKENNFCHTLQELTFTGNYIAAVKKAYMYKKPEASAKTKVTLGKNSLLIVTKKSGGFVYGKFNEKEKGWFCLKDLEEIKFVAPKLTN